MPSLCRVWWRGRNEPGHGVPVEEIRLRRRIVLQTVTMAFRLLLVLVVLLAVLSPAVASAAKPPAAVLADPTVTWVRVVVRPAVGVATPGAGRVVVRVLVRHAPVTDAAVGLRMVGSVTVVLSRFAGDRNYSIGGGAAARALPVLVEPIGVVYQVTLGALQSARVVAASQSGVLRALVLVDQRGQARGHAPARSGMFAQSEATALAVPSLLAANAPPLLSGGARRVIIGADAQGYSIVRRVELPISGGRWLTLTTADLPANGLVPASGAAATLAGTVTITGPDGSVLAKLPAPAGFTLAVRPKLPQRATLVWPAFDVPGSDPVLAGSAIVLPPPIRR